MQNKSKKDLQEEIYDQKVTISRLYNVIDLQIAEINRLNKKRTSGSIVADVEDVLNDTHFMYRMGETKVKINYREGFYCMMEGVNDNEDVIA